MFCKTCGCRIEESDRFCPACGAKNEPDFPAANMSPDPADEYAPVDSGFAANTAYPDDDIRTMMVDGRGIGANHEPDMPAMIYDGYGTGPREDEDSHTVVLDGYGIRPQPEQDSPTEVLDGYSFGPQPEQDSPTEVLDGYSFGPQAEQDSPTEVLDGYSFEPQPYGYPDYAQPPAQTAPPVSYQDSFNQQPAPRFGDSGYRDQSQSKQKAYQKTTAGKRIGSILLCLLILLFGFSALIIGTLRLSLTESNVRKAYQKGTLADLVVMTDKGEQSLAEILMDGMVDGDGKKIPLDKSQVEQFLRRQNINNFTENLLVDFTQFFVFGKKPSLLNEAEIEIFLRSISEEIREEINYRMSDKDIEKIGERINGGDLSFLSIDDNGGGFKTKYHVDPSVISNAFSIWALAICAGVVLICMVLIFMINRKNLPAGLSFNGATLVFFGTLNLLIAVGLLVLSYIKTIFFFSEIIRYVAIAYGAISIGALVIGIIFEIIKTVLRNRIR